MSDIASIASGAVSVYQRALGTISNNIANAATPGYSRQEITLEANPLSRVGTTFLGTGVSAEAVKRQYDAFVEANYRNSNSDLLSQEPMVSYTNRVVDVLGSDSMGLSSALDQFFNSARKLSTDPASSAMRGSFLGDAKGLASRFGEISSQLELVLSETTEAVNNSVAQINSITYSLAQVNAQLTKQKNLSEQPADLLDQRDLLLKSLSDYVHVNTQFSNNGVVKVSLGPSFIRDVVVDGTTALRIGANFSAASPEKVSLITDPYGKDEPLNAITSGKLAGLLSFREQVLGSARASLDTLTKAFVNEVNKVQEAGIDAYGNAGTALFSIDSSAISAAGGVKVAFDDPMRIAAAAQFRIAEAALNTSGALAKVDYQTPEFGGPNRLKTLADYGISQAQYMVLSKLNGLSSIDRNLLAEQLGLSAQSMTQLSAAMVNSGWLIAQPSSVNPLSTILSLSGPGKKLINDIDSLPFGSDPALAQKINITPGVPVKAVATIPNGLQDINLYAKLSAGQNLQVFTRDGRQILGSVMTQSQLGQLITAENGFAQGATYSGEYRNKSGTGGYKEMTAFYGARADMGRELQWDLNELNAERHTSLPSTSLPAVLRGTPLPQGLSGTVIGNGALKLNGVSLGPLTPQSGGNLQATDVKAWLDGAQVPGIRVSASNEIKIPPGQVDPQLSLSLTVGGAVISISSPAPKTVTGLISAINGATNARVSARLDVDGSLILSNAIGYEGESITVSGTIPNALGLANGTYTGQVAITRDLAAGQDTPVEVSLGASGSPDDLRKIGLNAQAYLKGQPDEDLLVFITGAGDAQVSATYSGEPVDPQQALRTRPLEVRFDADNHYFILDRNTNTVVASRAFDPQQLQDGISYQGLTVSFTAPPKAGDVFTIDGNRDGTGNNQNMLEMVDLQKARLMGGGKTFGEAYVDQVNDIGNVARQATIAQSALKVVNDQAITARDQVAGVSMDEEAADLIRFQQAYQASAKVLQVASQIFDSILQVR